MSRNGNDPKLWLTRGRNNLLDVKMSESNLQEGTPDDQDPVAVHLKIQIWQDKYLSVIEDAKNAIRKS